MSKYKHIHHGFQIDPLGVNFTPVQGGIFLIIMQKKKTVCTASAKLVDDIHAYKVQVIANSHKISK